MDVDGRVRKEVQAGHVVGSLDPDCRHLLGAASQRVIEAFAPETGFVERDDAADETRPISRMRGLFRRG